MKACSGKWTPKVRGKLGEVEETDLCRYTSSVPVLYVPMKPW